MIVLNTVYEVKNGNVLITCNRLSTYKITNDLFLLMLSTRNNNSEIQI